MNTLFFYLKRLGICTLVIVIYFYGLRPVRVAITQQFVGPELVEAQTQNSALNISIRSEGVALWITLDETDFSNEFQYRPQFGFFFLVALLTLIFATVQKKWYFLLMGLHLMLTCMAGILILLSKSGWYTGLIMVDLIVRYIAPALSLSLAAWVVAKERNKKNSLL